MSTVFDVLLAVSAFALTGTAVAGFVLLFWLVWTGIKRDIHDRR